MTPFSLVLIMLVFRTRGFLLYRLVTLFHVRFLIIVLSFSVSVPDVVPPGPGLWKLNISVLEEEEYVNLIYNFWTDRRQKQDGE